jgi:DNA-binding LytR/AlgR family response regulator
MDVFSYLNRPLSFERFLTTITKIQDYLSTTIYIHHARNNRFVFIKSEYKIIKVKFEDILFCEGMKDYTQVYLKGKIDPILTLNNLKSFSYKLPPEEFIRVHRSFIVSLTHIDSIARNEIYIGKKIIPIGDSFKDDFYQIVEWNS